MESFRNHTAKKNGTELHTLAEMLINKRVNLPRNNKTLNMYVNDAIGYNMDTEVILKYSFNCYGSADSIVLKKNVLRIHDLKTGVSKASFTQHKIYAALFCLEYDVKPNDITIELRIYQNDERLVEIPEPEEILIIMGKIIYSDRIVEKLKNGG